MNVSQCGKDRSTDLKYFDRTISMAVASGNILRWFVWLLTPILMAEYFLSKMILSFFDKSLSYYYWIFFVLGFPTPRFGIFPVDCKSQEFHYFEHFHLFSSFFSYFSPLLSLHVSLYFSFLHFFIFFSSSSSSLWLCFFPLIFWESIRVSGVTSVWKMLFCTVHSEWSCLSCNPRSIRKYIFEMDVPWYLPQRSNLLCNLVLFFFFSVIFFPLLQ